MNVARVPDYWWTSWRAVRGVLGNAVTQGSGTKHTGETTQLGHKGNSDNSPCGNYAERPYLANVEPSLDMPVTSSLPVGSM